MAQTLDSSFFISVEGIIFAPKVEFSLVTFYEARTIR
jgi:hypothetical protein